jgi:phytoene dehydrogenase-like protein
MSGPQTYDAIVVGGGVHGLVAASYLARANRTVLLLEAGDEFGGLCHMRSSTNGAPVHALQALDPLVIGQLRLARRGLRFAVRDMSLTGLHDDGRHINISRDIHETVASLAVHSQRDAQVWPRFRNELFTIARAMRSLWWEESGHVPDGSVRIKIDRIARMGAAAWLDSWFASNELKAALCFDATVGGHCVLEPGSALSLVWRTAQEMSGLQGAVAIPFGGAEALVKCLLAAAREKSCELRTASRVARVVTEGDRVAGVELGSGERCIAPIVMCAVPRRSVLLELLSREIVPMASAATMIRMSAPLAEARMTITLRSAPRFGGTAVKPTSRFIVAGKPEAYTVAALAAHARKIADELPMEFVLPTAADPALAPSGQHVLSILIRPVPRHCDDGWTTGKATLVKRVLATLQSFSSTIPRDTISVDVLTPDDLDTYDGGTTVEHILSTYKNRIETPVHGLFLCGGDAEPVPSVSGRAARLAAALAMKS